MTGGFCGYRNIQMLTSYIIEAKSQGHEKFKGKIPSIFAIQDYIENAWDFGINATGREETGGIRGTRKYIGTPDVSPSSLCAKDFLTFMQGASNVHQSGNSVSHPLNHLLIPYMTRPAAMHKESSRRKERNLHSNFSFIQWRATSATAVWTTTLKSAASHFLPSTSNIRVRPPSCSHVARSPLTPIRPLHDHRRFRNKDRWGQKPHCFRSYVP